MGWGWGWRPRQPKRKPANGIKARTQGHQKFGQTWWAGKWLAALERLVDPARLGRGRSYARGGQVLSLDIRAGRVASKVQGSMANPYKVRIEIEPLDDKAWDRVITALAARAAFAARLLAGEMPPDIEEAFAAAGASLFPARRGDLDTDCTCPDYANPCKHVSAVYYLLSEQFDVDPFLLFQLRGRTRDQVTAALRARRTAADPGAAAAGPAAHPPEAAPETAPPLAEQLAAFWSPGGVLPPEGAVPPEALDSLPSIPILPAPPEALAAPVRRLGEPPFWRGKPPFGQRAGSAYAAIARAALALALGESD
jgi:uncharacterized Zn finger protein